MFILKPTTQLQFLKEMYKVLTFNLVALEKYHIDELMYLELLFQDWFFNITLLVKIFYEWWES